MVAVVVMAEVAAIMAEVAMVAAIAAEVAMVAAYEADQPRVGPTDRVTGT